MPINLLYDLRKNLLVGFFLICHWGVFSQDYDYINYTTKDGLPTNYVYGVIEDDDGSIWAYTENGMSKFDGYTFQNYSSKDGLPGNDIVSAVKDANGRIFLWAYSNKPAYLENDTFYKLSDSPSVLVPGLDNGNVVYGSDRNSYFSVQEKRTVPIRLGLIDSTILMKERESFQLIKSELRPTGNERNIFESEPKYIVATKDSVFYFTLSENNYLRSYSDGYLAYFGDSKKVYWKKQGKVVELADNNFSLGSFSASNNQAGFFEIDQLGKYLLRDTEFGIQYIDFEREVSRKINLKDYGIIPESHFHVTILDSSFVLSTDKGVLEFNFSMELIEQLLIPDLVDNFYILMAYKDSNGNYWIGTREGGLFFFPKQKRNTSRLTSNFSKDKSFEKFIHSNDGTLLAITDNCGVYQIRENQIVQIIAPNKKNRFRSATTIPQGVILSGSHQSNLLQRKNDRFQLSNLSDQFKYVAEKGMEIKKGYSNAILPPKNLRSLSYGVENSTLYSIDAADRLRMYRLLNGNTFEFSFTPGSFNCLYFFNNRNKLFAGGSDGLFVVKGTQKIPFLKEHPALRNISTINGSGNSLWIGTENNGLFHYSFSTKKIEKVASVSNIRNIKFDREDIFVASNDGVIVFPSNFTSTQVIMKYTTSFGLPTNEVLDVHPTEDGKYIYAATSSGLYKIDRTKNITSSLSPENLKLQKILVNQEEILLDEVFDFAHLNNNFEFHFHLQSYESNGNIKYFTKLEPLQSDWNESAERKVNYFSLVPDDYVFHLKAEDIYGNVETTEPVSLKIKKAYWQTTFFKVGCGVIFFGGLWYWFSRRERKRKAQTKQEKKINRRMAELELSALRAQMNPHFVFNALGAIQYYIQTNEVEAADDYLTKFARLMRKYLDSSKQKMIPLKNEIELLKIYTDLEQLRFEDLFDVKIDVQKNVDPNDVFIPTMLIQPFVENAINHGLDERRDKKGKLDIRFYQEKDSLICEVSDNGVGRKNTKTSKRKGHQSRGLGIINEKIQTLRASELYDITLDIQDKDKTNPVYPGTNVLVKIKNLQNDQH